MSVSCKLTVPFNLDVTLCCGQVFRWFRQREWWFGVVNNNVLKIRQTQDKLEFSGMNEDFVKNYFSLDHDLQCISREIGKDEHIKTALQIFWGLRLIKQEPWECLISFICATYKSITAICSMLQKLSESFGESLEFEGRKFYGFPSAKRLACSTLSELKECGLGYRARYVLETSKIVTEGYDFEVLRELSYKNAKRKLLEFPGVGSKVADCVLLFSLDKFEAFPIDVWMKRVLLRHYATKFDNALLNKLKAQAGLSDSTYEHLNVFSRTYFGRFAGYAQEYLYHYERYLENRKVEKGYTA